MEQTTDIILLCIKAFLVGGLLCGVGQLLIDLTKLTPARILVGYVVSGVFLTAIGVYERLISFGDAGASVPLTGFGYALANGAKKAVDEYGLIGAITGGLTATAAGITAALLTGLVMSLIFNPKEKK